MTRSADRAGEVRIALLGVSETPVRAVAAEKILTGTGFGTDEIAAAVDAVRAGIDPSDDLHASADYRRHLAGVLAERALSDAWGRAGNGAS